VEGLSGKVVLVTGAGRSLGRAYAIELLRAGAGVALTDIDLEPMDDLQREFGDRLAISKLDVTDQRSWAAAVSYSSDRLGSITGLVNNAGIAGKTPLMELTVEEYRRFVDVNEIGVLLGMQAVVPGMIEAGGGAIVNISSVAGLRGRSGYVAYSGTKFAVTGMTKAAAAELGQFGIRVNSIHPGNTAESGMYERAKHRMGDVLARQPIPRAGTPGELAGLVKFLISDESGFCTGSEFVADGGITAIF